MKTVFAHRFRYIGSTLLLAGMWCPPLQAENTHCPVAAAGRAEALGLTAQRFTGRSDGVSSLSGDVQFRRGNNRVRADRAIYNTHTRRIEARGNVLYTNCDPRNPAWFISADRLMVSPAKGFGTVRNAWLHVGGVPVFYTPRYRILLDDRRETGFLTPKFAYSSNSGAEIETPFYFNLAPNRDAVLAPRYYSKRGLQLGLKFRYLHPLEEGRLRTTWLDDDDYGEQRYSLSFNHRAEIDDFFSLNIQQQRVSDTRYMEDLSDGLTLFGESYLQSSLDSKLFWRGWEFQFFTEALQRADDDADRFDQPYQRRPSFSVGRRFSTAPGGFEVEMSSEITQFVNKHSIVPRRDGDSADRVSICRREDDRDHICHGNRFHNSLRMSWPYSRPGFHFTPAVALHHTQYKLYREGSQRRTLPVYSLRTGLVFEKNLHLDRYRHTLEPELFYLHIPRRDQDEIPLFDTGETEFRFERLFDENRFSGADRIGDADQLTLALSSRALHRDTGKETLRASIGRTLYFKDRKVGLERDTPVRNDAKSDLAGEVAVNLNDKARFLSSLVWNSGDNETMKHTTRLSLGGGSKRIINLFHRFRRNDFEQAGISLNLPLNNAWSVFASWTYDLDNSEDLNTLAGLEYRSCCWSLRLAAQRQLKDVDNPSGRISDGGLDYDTFIGFEFSMRGFGKLGNDIDEIREQKIFGYRAP